MASQSVEDVKDMTKEEKEEYCKWCWHHSGGYCYECALYKGSIPEDYKNKKLQKEEQHGRE